MRALIIVSLLGGSVVLADDLPAPPDNCPAGSIGNVNHSGPHCRPWRCQNDTDCAERPQNVFGNHPPGWVCRESSVCIQSSSYPNRWGGGTTAIETVGGRCGANDACDEGSCTRERFCVPGSEPATMNEPATMTVTMNEPAMNEPAMNEPANEAAATNDESGCAVASAPATSWLLLLLAIRKRRH